MPRIDVITGELIPDEPVVAVIDPVNEPTDVVRTELLKVADGITKEITRDKWTNIQVDSTVLSMFMACPRKYEYVMKRHLVPAKGIKPAFKRGSIVHDALLAYWRERIKTGDYQMAVQSAVRKAKEQFDKESMFTGDEKLYNLGVILEFLKYIQGMNWIPLEAEKFFRIPVYEDQNLKLRIWLTGRIDLIVKTPQIECLPIDLKTESERWFHTQMSNQFRIYCMACEVNLLGVQRVGFQEKLEVKDKFKLELLPFDPDILEEWRTETLPYYVKQLMIAHEDNYFPMNTTNCVHGHFKCEFSDANDQGFCNVSRNIREQKLSRYFVIGEPWDPSKTD
jgi:hypothetical protein